MKLRGEDPRMTKFGGSAERIAQEVIARIQRRELATGDRLREQALADEFGVSRGPVREALRLLASGYWVALEPGKGARVTGPTEEPEADGILVAAALLGVAARLAAANATPSDIAEIGALSEQIAAGAIEGQTPEAFIALTWRMGMRIVEAAHNARLREYLEAYGGLYRIAPAGLLGEARRLEVARRWVDIALALRNRDGHAAERLLRGHIEDALLTIQRRSVNPALWD